MIEPTVRNPQLGSALALVQLLTEHPDLPVADWHVCAVTGALKGSLHEAEGTFEALGAYAHLLGGSIRPGVDFESNGQRLRSHELSVSWRDVRVRVTAYIPLEDSDRYLGALADQRHQYVDLDADATCRDTDVFKAVA